MKRLFFPSSALLSLWLFSGCLPGARKVQAPAQSAGVSVLSPQPLAKTDLKLTVKVVDADTGLPIPDAWVLVTGRVTTDRPAAGGDEEAVAATRGITDQGGVAQVNEVQGTYFPAQPKTKLWVAMEEARAKRLGERKIAGMEGGSIVVASPKYGFIHQPFAVEDSPAFADWLKKNDGNKEGYGGWLGRKTVKTTPDALFIQSKDLNTGVGVVLKIRKPGSLDEWAQSISPVVFWDATWLAMSRDTGATEEEKRRIYMLFAGQMDEIAAKTGNITHMATFATYMREEAIKYYMNHAVGPQDESGIIQLWLAGKALESLTVDDAEIKQYAQTVLKGVEDEGRSPRWKNHYLDPKEPSKGLPGHESALTWGAIGYAENPNNEWDWEDAQRYYREGDRAKAYEALGHVLRLLTNLAIPKYTQLQEAQESEFENAIQGLLKTNGNNLLPDYWRDVEPPKMTRKPRERLDEVAKRAGSFGLQAQLPAIALTNGAVGSDMLALARKSLPTVISQGAGLLRDFHRLMNPAAFVQAPGDGGNGDILEVEKSTDTLKQRPRVRLLKSEARPAYEVRFNRHGNGRVAQIDDYSIRVRNRLFRFKIPHEITPSCNGKYFAVFPAEWGYDRTSPIREWDYEQFGGVIDINGNILWQNPDIEKVDRLSDDGMIAYNVIPSGETSPWSSLDIYQGTTTIKFSPLNDSVSHTEVDISTDGSRLALATVGKLGAVVLLFNSDGKELWRKIYPDFYTAPHVSIAQSGRFISILYSTGETERRQFAVILDNSGNVLWSRETQKGMRKTKAIFSHDEKRVLFAGYNSIDNYETVSGNHEWKYENKGLNFSRLNISDDGHFISATCKTTINDGTKREKRTIILLDENGHRLWEENVLVDGRDETSSIGITEFSDDGNILYLRAGDKFYQHEISR